MAKQHLKKTATKSGSDLSDLSGYKPKTHIGKQTAAVRDEWKRIARAELRKDPKNGLKKASKIYAAIRKEKGIKLKTRAC